MEAGTFTNSDEFNMGLPIKRVRNSASVGHM
jgi:hypothetical protein